jgi:hypothetical protein
MTMTMMATADWRRDTTTMAMAMVAAGWAMGYTDDGYGGRRQCNSSAERNQKQESDESDLVLGK